MNILNYDIFPCCIGKLDKNSIYVKNDIKNSVKCCQQLCKEFKCNCKNKENFENMPLEIFKKRYLDGIEYVYKHSPWLFQFDYKHIQDRKNMLKKVTNFDQLIVLNSPVFNLAQNSVFYTGVEPMKNSPNTHMQFKYDQSPNGWYFMYGQTKSYRFTYIIYRISVSPIEKNKDQVLYSISGGFDYGNGWQIIPRNSGPGNYTVENNVIYFNYSSKNVITSFSISEISKQNDNYKISGNTTFNNNTYIFELLSTNKGHYNGKSGCVPVCFDGLGTSYWSFTNMICNVKSETGKGWFDHQWANVGIPKSFVNQIIYSIVNGGKILPYIRWLWLNLQLNDKQYMLKAFLTDKDLPLKIGDKFQMSVNKYTNTSNEYGITGTAEILKTIEYDNISFPIKYKIIIDNQTYVLSSINNDKYIIIMPQGTYNWEGPGEVFVNDKRIGYGFLEANNLSNNLDQDVLQKAGLSGTLTKITLSNLGIFVFIFMCIFTLFLIVFVLWLILKKKSKKN
jgi:hypothetical protein